MSCKLLWQAWASNEAHSRNNMKYADTNIVFKDSV